MPRYEIVGCNDEGISRCAEKMRSGAVIVFPTDTVYGIGCDPYNDSAVARIFALKSRAETKPLPVLVRNQEDAEKIVDLGEKGRMLAVKYWPGKLTILAPLLDRSISNKVAAGGSLLGVRVPSNKCALDLLEKCRYLVGTSANISGRPPLRGAEDVKSSGLDGFDILLDGGRIGMSKESTVFDIRRLQVVRHGALSEKSIFETIGEC